MELNNMVEYPLKSEEWEWKHGGYTNYIFANKITKEEIKVTIPETIQVSTSSLYDLVEEIDHWNIIGLIKEKYGNITANIIENKIEELRKIISDEWHKKYDGNLPHLIIDIKDESSKAEDLMISAIRKLKETKKPYGNKDT